MTFSRQTLLLAAIALGTSVVPVNDAQAGCHGSRGGGYSRGFSSRSYGYGSYGHSSPRYTYSQQVPVIQPVQPVQQIQPVMPQQAGPGLQQPAAPQQTLQPVAPQQGVAPQQIQQNVAPQQGVASQQTQQNVVQQQTQQNLAPQQTQQPAAQPQTTAPQQTQAPANAQMSALQALGGFAPPQSAPVQQAQTPSHVGTWTASLGNGASVRLVLQADGQFSWAATNKTGTASSFSGSYTVGNGTLTLTRSGDDQQLAGSMTNSSNGFSFKVAGNNAAAIDFARG